MPRDASGSHTLPAGHPVVGGTIGTATGQNALSSDLSAEITNSLDRQGRGGMLAALKAVDGSVSAPGVAFKDEINTGFYRAGTNDVRLAIGGADALRMSRVWRSVVATADTVVSSNVVASDIAGLSFACASDKRYIVRAHLFTYAPGGISTGRGVSAKATGAPTTSSKAFVWEYWDFPGGTLKLQIYGLSDFLDTPDLAPLNTVGITAAFASPDVFHAHFVTTSTGTFALRLISEVNASDVTVMAGSYLEWMEI